MSKAMSEAPRIIAGFGMGSRVSTQSLLAVFARALAVGDVPAHSVLCAATLALRQPLPAFRAAMGELRLPVRAIADADLRRAAEGVVTRSARILARHGVGSVAEAAALAAAGPGARLLVPRQAVEAATCALAFIPTAPAAQEHL